MDICLVNIAGTFRGVEERVLPLGLLYLSDALKKAGYSVKVFHISESDIEQTVKEIVDSKPFLVGFSVITGVAVKTSANMSKKIKELSDIPILWGGVHSSLCPKETLEYDFVDYIIVGEGEETVVQLAEHLTKGKNSIRDIGGVGYKENGKMHINERPELIKNLDDYKLDWSAIDIEDYIKPQFSAKRGIVFVTSRGCPFNCGFCYNREFNYNRWRAHSVEYVVKELNRLKKEHKINAVMYYDDNFFVDKKRALEILRRVNLPFWADIRIDSIDEDFARKLAELKCQQLFIGIESGNDKMLKKIGKGFKVKDTIEKIRILSKYPQIRIKAAAIVGFPKETKKQIKDTLRLVTRLYRIHPNIDFNLGMYLPYPGSSLYKEALSLGFELPNNPERWADYDIAEAKFKITWLDWAKKKDINALRNLQKCVSNYTGALAGKWRNTPIMWPFKFFAYLRIRFFIMSFPIDIYFFHSFQKIIRQNKILLGLLRR